VVRLALPPLRARREDIPALAQRFLAQASRRLDGSKRFAPATLQRLTRHDWPGNVRELENLCWRLAVLAPGETVQPADLPRAMDETQPSALVPDAAASGVDWETALRRWADAALAAGTPALHGLASERLERVLFDAALSATDGHRQQAAQRLGLGRNTLTRKLGSGRRDAPS
jgi:two-component system nitrogen regulation response regulator GlnG